MSTTDGLVIIERLNDVSRYTRIALRQFPKHEKFILGQEIRESILTIRRLTVRALKRYYKKTTLEDMDIEIEVLRHLIRDAVNLEYVDLRRYEEWSRLVNEVGKILGAWLKNVKRHEK